MRSRLLREERGSVMVIAAAALTLLLLFAGMALDFGRQMLHRTNLQNAVDAAALSGALQIIPMVRIRVDRWEWVSRTCKDPVTGTPYDCSFQRSTSPVRREGKERDLLYQNGWRRMIAADCRPPFVCADTVQVERRWEIYAPNVESAAKETFWSNVNLVDGSRIEEVQVMRNSSKVEVTVRARMQMPTYFLKLIGIRTLTVERIGSGVPIRR